MTKILIDEATVKMALEALDGLYLPGELERVNKAISDLRQALAEQPAQQEPVAWGVFSGPSLHDMFFTEEEAQDMAKLKGDGSVVRPLCDTAPAQQEYERGFIDGMQKQMQSSVDKAVNQMANMARTTNKMLGHTSPTAQRTEQEPIPFGIRGSIAHDLGIKNNFSNQRSSKAAHGIKENT